MCAAVPIELGASPANKATIKLAWESIAAARIGRDRMRRVMLQRLLEEREGLIFQPGEQVEDFALRLTNLMEQMARNGDTNLTEERVVEKFLRCMSKRYAQMVNSIETLLDFEHLTVKDVTRRLVGMKTRLVPGYTSKLEESARWSCRSTWLPHRGNRSCVLLPRRASQFDPTIDKERKFISNLRWNMPVCAQTVPSVSLREQPDRKID